MPIGPEGSLFFERVHVTDGERGFHPYAISIKPNGTYIEGAFGHLLHISLHHQVEPKKPNLSRCHITIPKESERRVVKHGFSERQYFKWSRQRALGNSFHRAALLIFPWIFGEATLGKLPNDCLRSRSVELRQNATIIEVWFGDSRSKHLSHYLAQHGKTLVCATLPGGESVAVNITHDEGRDYQYARAMDNFGRFSDCPGETHLGHPALQLHVGPHGENCMGILHGSPKYLPSSASAA